MQATDLEEEAGHDRTQQDEEACGDEAAEEAHVLAGDQHIGRQATEHQRRHGEGRTDDFSAAAHAQVAVEDRAENEAHETGEGEGGDQAPYRVAQLGGEEEQAIEADEHDEHVRVREPHLL